MKTYSRFSIALPCQGFMLYRYVIQRHKSNFIGGFHYGKENVERRSMGTVD